MNISRSALFFLVGTLALVPVASAGSDSTTFTVNASVDTSCTIANGQDMDFGPYDTSQGPNPAFDYLAVALLDVQCTAGTHATIELDAGIHASGAQRRMINGNGDFLEYSLWQDTDRQTTPWGTGADAWPYVEADGLGDSLGVQGRLPLGQQAATAGAYQDTVTATITF